jgi:hypothetical protein
MASTPAQGKTNAPAGVSAESASFVTRKINGLAKPVSGIIGPASVIQVELIDGRQWDEAVSKGGVVGYVSHIAKPALRERDNRKTGGARPRKELSYTAPPTNLP